MNDSNVKSIGLEAFLVLLHKKPLTSFRVYTHFNTFALLKVCLEAAS